MPAILPALMQKARLQIERNSLQQCDPTLIAHPIYIVWMAKSRTQAFFDHLVQGESAIFQRNPVRVEHRSIGRQDSDGMANSIGDRAKVFLTLPQLIVGAFAILDVNRGRIPSVDFSLLIQQRTVADQEPAVEAVLA